MSTSATPNLMPKKTSLNKKRNKQGQQNTPKQQKQEKQKQEKRKRKKGKGKPTPHSLKNRRAPKSTKNYVNTKYLDHLTVKEACTRILQTQYVAQAELKHIHTYDSLKEIDRLNILSESFNSKEHIWLKQDVCDVVKQLHITPLQLNITSIPKAGTILFERPVANRKTGPTSTFQIPMLGVAWWQREVELNNVITPILTITFLQEGHSRSLRPCEVITNIDLTTGNAVFLYGDESYHLGEMKVSYELFLKMLFVIHQPKITYAHKEDAQQPQTPKIIKQHTPKAHGKQQPTPIKLTIHKLTQEVKNNPAAAQTIFNAIKPKRRATKRWIVRGHWRNQACGPGLKHRKRIFIKEHTSGNPQAPLDDRIKVVKTML